MSEIALSTPGSKTPSPFPGCRSTASRMPQRRHRLRDAEAFEERTTKDLSGSAIAQQLQGEFASIQDAYVAIFHRRR